MKPWWRLKGMGSEWSQCFMSVSLAAHSSWQGKREIGRAMQNDPEKG